MAPVFFQGDSYFQEKYLYSYHISAGSCGTWRIVDFCGCIWLLLCFEWFGENQIVKSPMGLILCTKRKCWLSI